jgi:Flp pilus assembly pilin Flp
MMRAHASLRRLIPSDDRGAGMVEYALLVLLVAIALVVTVGALGAGIAASLTDSASRFP